ncbi:MAG: hypothetical protein ACOYLO_09925, partial [Ferruginibacter sp.]
MFKPDNILNELQALSTTVANIQRVNVFNVPDDYFNNLSQQVLLLKNTADNDPAVTAAVPESYFNNLAETIIGRIKREAEVENKVEQENLTSILAAIGNNNIYSIPQGYFDHLSDNINAKILNQSANTFSETHNISELVASIGNRNIYSVPQDYFETLKVALNNTKTAKVVSIKSRFATFKYAVAAVVTGIIGLSVFFVLNNTPVKPSAETAAVMIEANEIIKTNSFDKELASISDDAIVAFLESKGQ